jgi:hypothetical protein
LSYPGRSDDRVVCYNWLLTCQRDDSDGILTARCATQLDHQAYRGSSTDRACSPSDPVDRACDQGWFQYVHHDLADRKSVDAFVLIWPSRDVCSGGRRPRSLLVGWKGSCNEPGTMCLNNATGSNSTDEAMCLWSYMLKRTRIE